MLKNFACYTFIVLVIGLLTTASYGQLDGLYEFDGGGDGTSWDDAANWEQKLDPFGVVISGDPATPPSPTTSADIPQLGVVLIDGTQAGQTALDVSIGTAAGSGSLNISGGDLTGRDVNVGSDAGGINLGILAMTGGTLVVGDDLTLGDGSPGIMTMSGGSASTSDDLNINANSSLTMTGGTLEVGDNVQTSSNAGIVINGGTLIANDDFRLNGDVQVTVNSGLMVAQDKMRFDGDATKNGKVTINGGIVRSNEFHFDVTDIATDFRGVVEINGDGVYQVEQGDGTTTSSLTVATAQALIDQGVHFITSEVAPLHLAVQTVIVPEFFGATNVAFTQISVVPEPGSLLLLSLGGLSMLWRKRAR